MREFKVFRARILSVLAAAGVAQACGGTVRDGSADLDPDDPDEPLPLQSEPGCLPVLTAEERVSALRNGEDPNLCWSNFDVECIPAEELASSVLPCATALSEGRCPAPGDLTSLGYRTAVTGDARAQNGMCCYEVTRLSCAVPGRLLRVNGSICLPDVVRGASLPGASDDGLDPVTRRALSELWCEGARFEHASVAAFARITLQLLALGAPPSLVRASQDASLDEIEHARICFALASRFAGCELRAGRLPVDEAPGEVALVDLAVETVVGGCVGETVAALTAVAQLHLATDPEVRSALERIAEDEARHADLAWRILAWATEKGGAEVRARITQAFDAALAEAPRSQAGGRSGVQPARSHGQLDPHEEHALRARILRDVVAPCAGVLAA